MKTRIICLFAAASMLVISCKKEQQETPVAPNTALDTNTPLIEQPTNEEVNAASAKMTEMTFSEMAHNFGVIPPTESVSHVFKFTNTGKNDLLIASAKGSCGCTVPEYPKEPIPPGKTGTMKVTFSPKGKNGPQHKTVNVMANVPNGGMVLNIEADILLEK